MVGTAPNWGGSRASWNVGVGQTSLHIQSTIINVPGICAGRSHHIGEQLVVPTRAKLSLVGETDMPATTKNTTQCRNTTHGEVQCGRGW